MTPTLKASAEIPGIKAWLDGSALPAGIISLDDFARLLEEL